MLKLMGDSFSLKAEDNNDNNTIYIAQCERDDARRCAWVHEFWEITEGAI